MRWLVLSSVLALGACTTPGPQAPDASLDLSKYYATAEAEIRAAGGMRSAYFPADAPFTKAELARNFMRIALFDEYKTVNGRYVPGQTPANLRRFERPVLVKVVNGAATNEADARLNTTLVAQYTRRLARITGADIRFANQGERANMVVFFLNRAEQPRYARELARYVTAPPRKVEETFANSPENMFCNAFSLSPQQSRDSYTASVILIKSEQSGALRSACVQEEMAQALGLPNDSPEARPSIFNDDEEFAALTKHDELLLQILYDPRLKPGMNAAEVRLLLPAIIDDIW